MSRLRTEHQRTWRRGNRLDRVLRGAGRLKSLELRALTNDLHVQLERASSPDRDERLFVIDPDLTELLRLHPPTEERAAYDWIERLLSVARRGPHPRRPR